MMPISPRTTISIAEMITDFRGGMEFPEAFKLSIEAALLDKANPEDRAVIQGICDRRTHVGQPRAGAGACRCKRRSGEGAIDISQRKENAGSWIRTDCNN